VSAAAAAPRRLALGTVAGLAVAVAGSWLRFALTRDLALDTHGWPFVAGAAVAGAGLALSGVCALRLSDRAEALSWRALLGLALALQAVAAGALALTSSDVFTNLAFGALSLRGLSPYLHAPIELAGSPLVPLVPGRWVRDPTPYGPLFHPAVRLAAWVGERAGSPVWAGLLAYKALLALAVAAGLALAARHLSRRRPSDGRSTFALVALGPLLAWEVAGQGHNDGLLFLSGVAFAAAAAAGRDLAATVALAAGVAVKYATAPLLGLYLLLRGRRAPARAALLALIALGVLAAAFAWEGRGVTLRAVLPMVGGEAARHAHSLTDLVCLALDAAGQPDASRAAYRLLSLASALVALALLLRAALRADSLEALARGYLLFLFGLYLTTPWFQPWYVSWALPLLLLEPDPAWRRFVATFAAVAMASWALPLDPVTNVAADAWAAVQLWRLWTGRAGAQAPRGQGPACYAAPPPAP
jgi:hypothetical protein